MASIAVGSSQTFTAGVRDAVFVVVINGGTYATVTGAQSASLGPSPVRRSFGPFAVGESITVAVQSGDAAIVEYGDQTPGEVGGANSWLSGAQTSADTVGVAGVTASGSLVGPDGAAISTGGIDRNTEATVTRYSVTYTRAVTQGSGSSFPGTAAYSGICREKIIIRNPAGSPGSVLVGYQANPENVLDPNSPGTFTTVTAGQEFVEYFTPGQYRIKSADVSAPAGLVVEVELEGWV